MDLTELIKQKPKGRAFRSVIYGTDGIGKTTWASDAPNPVFLDLENGLQFIDAPRIDVRESSFNDILKMIGLLIKKEHEHKTLCIDSIDWLETKIWERVVFDNNQDGNKKVISSIEEIGYAKGYVYALEYWEQLLRGLDMLVNKNVNIILIAHGQVVKFQDAQYDDFDKWDLKIHKKAASLIREWSDCVMFANYKQYIKSNSTGFEGKDGSSKKKAVGDGERVLYTQEKPQFKAKCRFSIPDQITMEFQEFYNHYNEANN